MGESESHPSRLESGYPGKVLLVVVFTLFLNLFLYREIGPLGVGLFFLGYWLFISLAYLRGSNALKLKQVVLGTGMFVGLSLVGLGINSNGFVQFILGASLFLVTNFYLYLLASGKNFFDDTIEVVTVPIAATIGYVASFTRRLEDYLSGRLLGVILPGRFGLEYGRKLIPIIVGGILSLPIVFLLMGLLTSGDPIFGKEVGIFFDSLGKIFSFKFWQEPIFRVVISLVLFGAFLPIVFMERTRKIEARFLTKFVPRTEVTVLVILVAAILGAFLVVQWPYVFAKVAKETELTKFGVATYSEYVKKGFGEFVMVAVIVYGVTRLALGILKKAPRLGVLAVAQGVLLVEFLVFLASVFRRVYLYQEFHGWSLGRLYGGIFLVWVAALVVVLVARHLVRRELLGAEIVLTLVMVLTFGLFNAEGFLVSRPPTVNGRVDYVYLARLGSGGNEGWVEAYRQARGVLNKEYVGEEVEVKSGEVGSQLVGPDGPVGTPKVSPIMYQAKVIGREDRREIAYSRMITKALAANYFRLVKQYGTKTENDAFEKKVREFIGKTSQGSSENEKPKGQVEVNEWLGSNWPYDSASMPQFFYLTDEPYHKYRKYEGMNAVYNFNLQDYQAYQTVRDEVGLDNILELIEKYSDLHRRIASQPAEHKEYETDISFGGPFLRY